MSEHPAESGDFDRPEHSARLLKSDLEEAKQKLDEQHHLAESLQAFIDSIDEQSTESSDQHQDTKTNIKGKRASFKRLKVANRTTYETEIEHEQLPSPSPSHRPKRAIADWQQRKVARGREKASGWSSSVGINSAAESFAVESDSRVSSLMCKQTLPRRVCASAGAKAMWWPLIHTQTILLGKDHHLAV